MVLFLLLLAFSDGSDLPGHMQPLGSHRPPLMIETVSQTTKLTASSFYYNYGKLNKPVKFSGLLKDNDVIKNWQDDEYLKYEEEELYILYIIIYYTVGRESLATANIRDLLVRSLHVFVVL